MNDFVIIPHTADLKIRVYGKTLPDLYRNAMVGMFQSLKPIAPDCTYQGQRLVCQKLSVERPFGVDSPDQEALLVDFLSQALYLSDVHNEIYLDVDFSEFGPKDLMGVFKGVPITGMEESEIKAVTYHDLAIVQKNGLWQTDIVFDI